MARPTKLAETRVSAVGLVVPRISAQGIATFSQSGRPREETVT